MAAGPNRVTQGWRLCENAHVQGLGILIYSSFYLYKTNVWKWRLCCMEECKFITTIPSTTEMTLCCSFRSQTCSLQPHVRLHFSQFWAAALNTALRNNQRRHIWPSIYSVFTQIFFGGDHSVTTRCLHHVDPFWSRTERHTKSACPADLCCFGLLQQRCKKCSTYH